MSMHVFKHFFPTFQLNLKSLSLVYEYDGTTSVHARLLLPWYIFMYHGHMISGTRHTTRQDHRERTETQSLNFIK